ELGDLARAADVLRTVGGTEPEPGVDPVPQVVTIQHVGRTSGCDEAAFEFGGDTGFTGGRQPGQPHRHTGVGTLFAGDTGVLPVNFRGRRTGTGDHSRGNGVVGRLVDEYEAAGFAVAMVGVEHQRLLGTQPDPADLVQRQLVRLLVTMQRVDVQTVIELLHTCPNLPGRGLHEVTTARPQLGTVRHPADESVDVGAHMGSVLRTADQVTPPDVEFVVQLHGDCLGSESL